MTTIRFASIVVGLSLWLGVGLSAQQPGESSLRASIEREATRLASTLAPHDASWTGSTVFNSSAAQIERADDWDTVRRLKDGTRVVVTTDRAQGIRGRISVVTEATMEIIDRQGGVQMLRREEVLEVRLDRRFSVGQYVGLGLLVGGVAGLVIGRATECDCELRGLGTAMGAFSGTLMGAMGGWAIGGAMHAQPGRLVYRRAEP